MSQGTPKAILQALEACTSMEPRGAIQGVLVEEVEDHRLLVATDGAVIAIVRAPNLSGFPLDRYGVMVGRVWLSHKKVARGVSLGGAEYPDWRRLFTERRALERYALGYMPVMDPGVLGRATAMVRVMGGSQWLPNYYHRVESGDCAYSIGIHVMVARDYLVGIMPCRLLGLTAPEVSDVWPEVFPAKEAL